MNPRRRYLLLFGVLVIAALLAFPLRDAIYKVVIVPLAFLAFQLGLMYRSLSQGVWWWVLVAVVLFLLLISLLPPMKPSPRREPRSKPRVGQVEELTIWLRRVRGGTYFKWLVANRLGKLAYQMLIHRESGRPRSVFAPLVGLDWKPSKELQAYLEHGLHGSFADFPHSGSPFNARPVTPLDFEVRQAVEFLESQLENDKR